MASGHIQTLIADRKIGDLISLLEDVEFDTAGESKEHPPYSLQLLSYLIVNDLDSARFLWKRVPGSAKKDAQLNAAWGIGKCMWVKDYPSTHQALNSFSWDPIHTVVVNILKDEFRKRTLSLISNAYSSISATTLAAYIGDSVAEATAVAKSLGWAESGGFVSPVPMVDKSLHLATVENLQSLAEYSVYLETDFSIPSALREAAQAAAAYGQTDASSSGENYTNGQSSVNGLGLGSMSGMQNQNLRVGGQHNRALSMPHLPPQSQVGLGVNGYGGMPGWSEEEGVAGMH